MSDPSDISSMFELRYSRPELFDREGCCLFLLTEPFDVYSVLRKSSETYYALSKKVILNNSFF